jgi:hypothetical protein
VAGGEAEERYRLYARNSVFSHQRLLFTLLHHKTEIEAQFHSKLATEILKVLEEELAYRPFIFNQGIDIYIYVYMYIYLYIHINMCSYIHIYVFMYIHVYIHITILIPTNIQIS